MAVPQITKIEIIPQIWAYRKVWLDACLDDGKPITGSLDDYAGNFFGITDKDGGTFKWWELITWNDIQNETIISITLSDVSINDYRLQLKVSHIRQLLQTYAGTLYLNSANYESPNSNTSNSWVYFTPLDKSEDFVFPCPILNPGLNMPIRLRFLYKVTYTDSDGTVNIMQFPNNTAKPYFEVVLNSDMPFDFESTKEYTASSFLLLDENGVEITITDAVAKPDTTPIYLVFNASILGNQKSVDLENLVPLVWHDENGQELSPIRTINDIPETVQAVIGTSINSWILRDVNGNIIQEVRNNYLNPLNSFNYLSVFKIQAPTSSLETLQAFVREEDTNTYCNLIENPNLNIVWDFANPFVLTNGLGAQYSFDNSDLLQLSIENPAIASFTDIKETISVSHIWGKIGDAWIEITNESLSDIENDIPDIPAGDSYTSEIELTKEIILAWIASSVPAATISGLQFTLSIGYTGLIGATPTSIAAQTIVFSLNMIDSLTPYINTAQITASNNSWLSTKIFLKMQTSAYYANANYYKLSAAPPIRITQNTSYVTTGLYTPFEISKCFSDSDNSDLHVNYNTFEISIINTNNALPLISGTAILTFKLADTKGIEKSLQYVLPNISITSNFALVEYPDVSEIDGISESRITGT